MSDDDKGSNVVRLCEWLRANSSGIYRPARDAADLLESQAQEIKRLQEDLDAAVAAERERCARIAEKMDFSGPYLNTGPEYKEGKLMAASQIAAAIRAGSEAPR